MSKARDRSARSGSDPIIIGDDSNKILISKGSDNTVKFQTQAGSSTPANSSAGAVKVYASISDMTSTTPASGDMGLVTANSSLYVFNGGGWYKLAVINTSPTISSPSTGANLTLATDGTATSIELVGADVDEGTTLQNSYAVTTGSISGIISSVTTSATSGGTYSALAAGATTENRFFKINPVTSGSGGSVSLSFSMSDTINSATTVQNFTVTFMGEGSFDFASNSSYIEKYSSDFTMGTGDYTIEFWYKISSFGSDNYFYDLGSNGIMWRMNSTTSHYLYFGGYTISFSSVGVSTGTWYHARVTNASNVKRAYIDGVHQGTVTYSQNHTTTNIGINRYAPSWMGGSSGFSGIRFSNFRVIKGTALNTGTGSFTVPTSPLTAVTGTVLLTAQNDTGTSFTDQSASNHSLTVSGSVTTNTDHPF